MNWNEYDEEDDEPANIQIKVKESSNAKKAGNLSEYLDDGDDPQKRSNIIINNIIRRKQE